MFALKNVYKSFKDDNGNVKNVLSDFSFEVEDSKFYTVVGPNACGKSTVLNLFAGVIIPDNGKVIVRSKLNEIPHIGYVWQDYRSTLLPWYNVSDNITFPLKIKGVPKDKRYKIAEELLSSINIDLDPLQQTYELSGGQQQLVNLLRNMVIEPDILLLDEPFSALDQANRWSMTFRFEQLWLNLKIPVIFVSHDIDEAVLLADEIILLNRNGQIEKRIKNDSSRPRSVDILTTERHIICRKEIIEFLFEQGAIKNGHRGILK
jgi:NitT/TauT family transport system ATP-binding protein